MNRRYSGDASSRLAVLVDSATDFRIRTAAQGVTDKGHDQGKHHRRGGADGDRAHIRPHQAAHERHRQDRRDHCQGRKNGRIADLIDGFDRHLQGGPVRFPGMRQWRTMFSTTTMASSTRMPMEKIRANSVIRFSV